MSQDNIKYNPKIHHRRSIRLKGYDYSRAGAYFITICTSDRKCLFGEIINGEMMLNDYGRIANDEWEKLPQRFPNFELDVFQVMPNHVHGIIVLNESVGAGLAPAPIDNDKGATARVAPTKTVGDIVGAYKSLVANECLKFFKLQWEGVHDNRAGVNDNIGAGVNPAPTMGKIWQRNYYEHIIHNEQSYQTISNYIINNPANWAVDKFFIK